MAASPSDERHAVGGATLRRGWTLALTARQSVHELQQPAQARDAEAALAAGARGGDGRIDGGEPRVRDQRRAAVREHDLDVAVMATATTTVHTKPLSPQRMARPDHGHGVGERRGEFVCLLSVNPRTRVRSRPSSPPQRDEEI